MNQFRVATHPKKGDGVGECFYLGGDPAKAWDVFRKRSAMEMRKGKKITTLFRLEDHGWEPVSRAAP